MSIQKTIILLLCITVFFSCTSVNTASYLDKTYENYDINTVVVKFEGLTLRELFEVEETMKEKLRAYNITVIKYTDIIPPTKYNDEEWKNKIIDTNADSLLLITFSRDTNKNYVEPTYNAGVGNSPGYISGGYEVETPYMFTVTNLLDLKTDEVVMTVETESSGDEFINFKILIDLTCDDIIKELEKQNIIQLGDNDY